MMFLWFNVKLMLRNLKFICLTVLFIAKVKIVSNVLPGRDIAQVMWKIARLAVGQGQGHETFKV